VTITNGNSQSPAIDLGVARPRAIQTPATLTATVISFLASGDGGSTFAMVQDAQGTEITIAVSVSRFVVLEPAWFDGCQVLKLRLGTASAPITTEGADRSFFLVSQ
jgi:hypothetical protein